MAHNGDGNLSPFRFHSYPPPGRRGSLHDKDLAHSPPPKRRHPGLNFFFFLLLSTAVNKASGCNEIPAELFKSLKEDAIKVLHSLCQQIWKTQQWSQDWKRSILIPVPKKDSNKECTNHWTVTLISHASKVMLNILRARLQHYVNQELTDVQVGFRKGREARDQIANLHWVKGKARGFQENICFCVIDYAKVLVWIITNCGKLLERMEYQTILPVYFWGLQNHCRW